MPKSRKDSCHILECICAHQLLETQKQCRTYRAVEDHTVAVAHTLNVGGQVKADGPVANSVHGFGIKEVVGPRWRWKTLT